MARPKKASKRRIETVDLTGDSDAPSPSDTSNSNKHAKITSSSTTTSPQKGNEHDEGEDKKQQKQELIQLPTPPVSSQPSVSSQLPVSSQPFTQSQRDEWAQDADMEVVDGEEYDTNENLVLYGHLDGKIVGIQYYKGRASIGERVLLRREPTNPYDSNAIRMDNCGYNQIGHLPRTLASKLAPFIDSGKLFVEANIASGKGFYDVPITLHLYGTSDPVASAALKQEMKSVKLPVSELAQLERERKKAEKEREKRAQELHKKQLAEAAKNAGRVRMKNGSTGSQQQAENENEGDWANLTQYTDDSGMDMEQILEQTVSFNPRELDEIVGKWGAGEEVLSQLPQADQPKALTTKLLPYQRQGLAWMIDRENPQLPTSHSSKDSVQLWRREEGKKEGYINIATQFYSEKPSLASGGILADDMGLGKTIQIISLIVSDLQPDDSTSSPTLIVAPLSVMSNWSGQIHAHVQSQIAVKILTYHGANAKKQTPKELQNFDVVITTYETLAQEYMPSGVKGKSPPQPVPRENGLFSVTWRRVVLDEGHITRNPKTKKARAAHSLEARSRWVLTGTPIVNTLRDLYSQVKFLRLTGGLETMEVFSGTLIRPLAQGRSEASILLQALISTICLRRMKNMKFVDLRLPQLSSHLCPIKWLDHEKEKYDAFEKEAKGLLTRYQNKKNAKGENTYSHLLEVLLRLRQTCNHWSLCRERVQGLMEILAQERVELNKIGKKALQDLLQISIDSQEDCPVCLETLHNPVITSCKHCFGSECIERVIETQQKCPMCRQHLDKTDLVQPSAWLGESIESDIDAETSSSKIKTMMDILKASNKKKDGSKTIVFSQWTSFLDIVEKEVSRQGLTFCRLDGTMKAAERDAAIEQLNNNPACTIMLASLSVCSVGLNLVAANQVILSDTWWAPAIEDQAVDRVHRLGQTRPVNVFRLVMEGSVEERVINIQQNKRKLTMIAFQDKHVRRGQESAARLQDIEKLLG